MLTLGLRSNEIVTALKNILVPKNQAASPRKEAFEHSVR